VFNTTVHLFSGYTEYTYIQLNVYVVYICMYTVLLLGCVLSQAITNTEIVVTWTGVEKVFRLIGFSDLRYWVQNSIAILQSVAFFCLLLDSSLKVTFGIVRSCKSVADVVAFNLNNFVDYYN